MWEQLRRRPLSHPNHRRNSIAWSPKSTISHGWQARRRVFRHSTSDASLYCLPWRLPRHSGRDTSRCAPNDYTGSAMLQSAFLREMLLVQQVPMSPHTAQPIGRYMTVTFLPMVHFSGLIWDLQTVSCALCRSSVSMEVLLSRHVATSCCSRKMEQIQIVYCHVIRGCRPRRSWR